MKWLIVVLVLSNGQQFIVDDLVWETERQCARWLVSHPEIVDAPVSGQGRARAACVKMGAM